MDKACYITGEPVRLGDIVEVDGLTGQIVACMESGQYSSEFPEENWAYLREGVLWDNSELGLVHVPSLSEPDIVFIRRKHEDG